MKQLSENGPVTVSLTEGLIGNCLNVSIDLPEDSVAIAQDRDGAWFSYSAIPSPFITIWKVPMTRGGGNCRELFKGLPNPNWKDTLTLIKSPKSTIKNLRPAKSSDIVEGAEVFILGDDEELCKKTVEKVLRPDDQYKAFEADDGCRYGLFECFVKTTYGV